MNKVLVRGQKDMQHEQERQKLYSKTGCDWYDIQGEPYALLDVYVMSAEEVREIKLKTEQTAYIYDKTATLARELPDETLVELGIPALAVPFLREKALPWEGIIRRIDWCKTKDGWKHYEINSDTPAFIMECFRWNGMVAKHLGYRDANGGCEEQLSETIRNAIFASWKGSHVPKVVFTAEKWHKEDWGTISYLAELSRIPHEVVGLEDLRIAKGEGLYTPRGEKIDILFRETYPVGFMVEDKSEAGTLVGVELMKLVQQGKLAVINPFSSFLMQSKAMQALIWGLHEEGHEFFTKEEHDIIQKYFIPTYLDNEVFIQKGKKYVAKPVLGREGNTVVIYDEKGNALNENHLKSYDDQLKVYQEYVELPKATVMTPYGKTQAHILVGSFVIGDKAGAIGIRAGEAITGNESCFLPVGIK